MPCNAVKEWNRIRKADPRFVPNLCAADLEGLDLSGVTFGRQTFAAPT